MGLYYITIINNSINSIFIIYNIGTKNKQYT